MKFWIQRVLILIESQGLSSKAYISESFIQEAESHYDKNKRKNLFISQEYMYVYRILIICLKMTNVFLKQIRMNWIY